MRRQLQSAYLILHCAAKLLPSYGPLIDLAEHIIALSEVFDDPPSDCAADLQRHNELMQQLVQIKQRVEAILPAPAAIHTPEPSDDGLNGLKPFWQLLPAHSVISQFTIDGSGLASLTTAQPVVLEDTAFISRTLLVNAGEPGFPLAEVFEEIPVAVRIEHDGRLALRSDRYQGTSYRSTRHHTHDPGAFIPVDRGSRVVFHSHEDIHDERINAVLRALPRRLSFSDLKCKIDSLGGDTLHVTRRNAPPHRIAILRS